MRCGPPRRSRRATSSAAIASGSSTFGGVLRWLQPGMGSPQRYRLVETLLETGVEPTYTWRDVNVIPARILPPKALVLALTPLVDPRFIATLSRPARAAASTSRSSRSTRSRSSSRVQTEVERLAYRLWLLEREVLRSRLARLGIAVARWGDDVELDGRLEEVRTFRRQTGLARV